MTTLTLTHKAIGNKIKSIPFPAINWKLFYLLGILVFVSMLVYYIFLVNELTRGTYLIKNYNKEVSALTKENGRLETNFAQTSFLGSVTQKVTQLNFVKTTKVKYVQILDNSVAVK